MTREIKFRAVLPMNHWAVGKYGRIVEDYTSTQLFESLGFWSQDDGVVYPQYTGLKDKHGKEIYEGDRLFAKWLWAWPDRFRNVTVEVVWHQSGFAFGFGYDAAFFGLDKIEDFEIIGNIFENPELINPQE